MVRGEVNAPEGAWTFTVPCLQTQDLVRMAEWLEAIAEGRPAREWMVFIEPNLEFRLVRAGPEGAVLRVYFSLESRPPWAPKLSWKGAGPGEDEGASGSYEPDEPSITLTVTPAQLLESARELRTALRQFPVR